MQNFTSEIDGFIHGIWIISQSCAHTQSLYTIGGGVHEIEKHFVHKLGVRPQYEADKEDYEEEGSG